MDLEQALSGMLKTSASLRSAQAVSNPVYMSKQMMTLSSFTAAVEEHLARFEKDYEAEESRLFKEYMINQKMNATAAKQRVKIGLGEHEGQIKYLTRLVQSNWKQVGVIQSRYNHLVKEATNQI